MAEATQAELQLIKNAGSAPPPDNLIASPSGAIHVDLAKISTQGEFKRGTLFMAGADGYIPATQAGLTTANNFCILCDDITIGENEFIETPAYFEGDFHDSEVIFAFETENDDHDSIIELAREPLRKCKIFLRHSHI
ncbi:MAG: hypothetical protein IJT21_10170 [Synergistaceae bacterium]|nr:hypothetical protein [Synergistaceae bacterium]